MFKNLKVRSKLLVAFGILILFYLIAVIAALSGLGRVFGGLEDFYTPNVINLRRCHVDTVHIFACSDYAKLVLAA